MLRVIANRKNILGEDEWLVEWADLRPDGTKYPNDWVPDGNVSKDLKKAFRLSASFELKAPTIEVDLSPLVILVRKSICGAITKAKTKTRPRIHDIPIDALALYTLAAAMLELFRTPWRFVGRELPPAGRAALDLTYRKDDDGINLVQLCITDLEDISDILDLGRFVDGAHGCVRYNIGRASNVDVMAAAFPLVITVAQSRAPGLCATTIRFPTVHFNGASGAPTIPHMTTGMLKNDDNLARLVSHVRTVLDEHAPDHPLVERGWTQLASDAFELPDHVAVPA